MQEGAYRGRSVAIAHVASFGVIGGMLGPVDGGRISLGGSRGAAPVWRHAASDQPSTGTIAATGRSTFTASLMIASGMGTILSRAMHTRAVYVIGVATLLALSRDLFPDYFRNLPPFLESLTGSPLAVGLGAAILLHFVFLIGTRQKAEMLWSVADDSMIAALDFLRQQTWAWKFDAEIADLSIKDAQQVFEHLRMGGRGARNRLLTIYVQWCRSEVGH